MKRTALSHIHEELGAKMVEFAGYAMPVQYSGVNDEHMTVRDAVGVFDVSHMGEFYLRGPKALDLLQKISSNDVSKIYNGKAQYGCLPNNNGGIVDDFLTYQISEEEYLLVVNASNIQKDWDWIVSHNDMGVEMENASEEFSLLAVQGPKAAAALQSLTQVNLEEMKYYTFEIAEMAGISDVIISATGYTGAGGFELYVKNADAEKLWKAVFEAGAEHGIKPIGLAARDTLRLEKGFCLYGNDIDDSTSPLEAGLGWITKFTKDFVNSDALAKQKEEGVSRKLVGFKMLERGIPRHDYEIVDKAGVKIGHVTSGTMSPMLKEGIGLGYVTIEHSAPDSEISILIRNKPVTAVVTKIPFV